MKQLCLITLFVSLFLPSLGFAQNIPTKADVLDVMVLTNDYYMNYRPDPGEKTVKDRVRPSNIWTRATYYEGLMELYHIKPEHRYLDYAIRWGEAHDWKTAWRDYSRDADDQCCGQIYIDLYKMDPKPEYIEHIQKTIDMMIESDKIDDWWWIDALQMAMPVFARLGNLTGEAKYWDRMYDMYMFSKTKHGGKGLYNPKDGLWWRDADFVPPYKEPNGEDCYWSRGNGWVIAAMVRVLEQFPPNKKHEKEYTNMLKIMSKALVKVQREDGFWNVSLHDPNHYGGPETSGTAFFVYGMAWGVNNGILSKKKYLPVIMKAWNAMVDEAIHPNGFVGYVQGTGKEPASAQPVGYDLVPNFQDYTLGAFLLAGSEVYKLAQ